jgi:hypothetical protein
VTNDTVRSVKSVEYRATEPELRTVYCNMEENSYIQIIRAVISGVLDINPVNNQL